MPAKNKGALDVPTLGHIAEHAVRNSKDLLTEADMLYRAQRWSRAAALAVLAVEESGKAHLCHVWAFHVIPALDDPNDAEAWHEEQDGGLHVQVQDDGVGFAGEVPRVSARGHMGISSMRERAELQGGWCEISSLPGGGATVKFWVPGGAERAPEGAADQGVPRSIDAPALAG